MITNDGKEIISRYLLNQVPSYATHIAIGCGARPLSSSDAQPSIATLANMKKLDFEMLRVPISSKGFVNQTYSYSITNASLSSNIATLTTSASHNINIGDTVIVSQVNSIFNGTHIVYDTPSLSQFSFELIGSNTSASVSQGIVTVSKTKVSLTAELPTNSRYEITEVGLWSAPNNTLAIESDSYMIFNFSESWQAHDSSIYSPTLFTTLSTASGAAVNIDDRNNRVFYAFTNDPLFQTSTRKSLREGPRYLTKTLMVRGDSSTISGNVYNVTSASAGFGTTYYASASNTFIAGDKVTVYGSSNKAFDIVNETILTANSSGFTVASTITGVSTGGSCWESGSWTQGTFSDGRLSTHIHLNGVNLNIAKNNPSDILSIAFCLIDQQSGGATGLPDYVKILIEFYKSELITSNGFAKKEIYLKGSEFANSRYKVYSFPISELITSTDFSATDIKIVRVFTSIYKNGTESNKLYISYDGMRLDNVSTINPLYKLSGYSVVKTSDGYPIIKYENTNNYIDFRFNLGIT